MQRSKHPVATSKEIAHCKGAQRPLVETLHIAHVHVHCMSVGTCMYFYVGSQTMPKELEKFAIPWTRFQRKKSKNGYDTGIRRR